MQFHVIEPPDAIIPSHISLEFTEKNNITLDMTFQLGFINTIATQLLFTLDGGIFTNDDKTPL